MEENKGNKFDNSVCLKLLTTITIKNCVYIDLENPSLPRIVELNKNSPSIVYLCKKDKRLAKVIQLVGDISYAIHENQYEFLIHEIIEQMLSKKAGNKIFSRLADLCGGMVSAEAVNNLSDDEIKNVGTSSTKVSYIRSVTEAVLLGQINFDDLEKLSDIDVFNTLTSIKGIGRWTANMYLIFVLDRQDILPTNDSAFQQAFQWLYKLGRSENTIREKCGKWRPYSSIASRYLYRALDSGLTKSEFYLYK